MPTRCYFLLLMMTSSQLSFSQAAGRFYDLPELLVLATSNALELKKSNSLLKENQLQIALLGEQIKPQLLVNATLPNLSRAIESRPLPDGRDIFVNRSTMYNRVGARMNYQLASTGGTIYAESKIERLDILKTKELDYSRNYFFTPLSIGISQPLFQFNEVKWQKKRSELFNKELTAQQFFIREEVIQNTLEKYTHAFQAQLQLDLARQKVVETDSILRIKRRLFDIGKASKVELLRLDLELARNQQALEQGYLEWEKNKMALCDYLSLDYAELAGLDPPPLIQGLDIGLEKALSLALANVYISAQSKRRMAEAETAIEVAEKERGILFDISASLGLNKSSDEVDQLIRNLEDQQNISLGITVPISGGKSRTFRREIAQEQLFREQIQLKQEKIDLIRTVAIDVKSYTLLNKSIALNKKAMDVTVEIFQLSSRQYITGNQSITELNIARTERDEALLRYYRSILDATLKYYDIRKNCLYDFIEEKSLVRDEAK